MAALSRGCKPRRCDWDRKNPDFDIYSQTFKWILMILIQETPNREYFDVTVDLVNILDRNCRLRTLEMSLRGIEISKVCGHPSNYNSTIANWSLLQVVIFKSRKGLFVLWWKLPHAATFLLDQLLGQSKSTSGHFHCQIVMIDGLIPRPSNVRFQEPFFVTGYSAAVITLPNALLNENQAPFVIASFRFEKWTQPLYSKLRYSELISLTIWNFTDLFKVFS